jgi:hypothetical protein
MTQPKLKTRQQKENSPKPTKQGRAVVPHYPKRKMQIPPNACHETPNSKPTRKMLMDSIAYDNIRFGLLRALCNKRGGQFLHENCRKLPEQHTNT